MTKKIALIGGAGFVGSRLSNRLRNKDVHYNIYDINVSNNKDDKNIYFLDVEDTSSMSILEGVDTIVNLAAVHRDDIKPLSRYDDVNVQGAVNVCEVSKKFGINNIVFTSSVAIYGFAPDNTDETGEPNFFNDYGRTKYLAEKVYMDWYEEDPINRKLVIIRPTVIFGEANRGNVYNLLKQIASKRFIMFGKGQNIKSMAYVENVAAFLEFSLTFNKGVHIFNYIDKPDLDMNNLISSIRSILFNKKNVGLRLPAFIGYLAGYFFDAIAFLLKKTLPISSIRVKKFMSSSQFNTSIANTGFIAPIKLEDGLNKTITYEFLEDNSESRTFETE